MHTKHPPYTSPSSSKRAPDHKGPGPAAGLAGQGQGHQNHFCLGHQDGDPWFKYLISRNQRRPHNLYSMTQIIMESCALCSQ